MRIIKRTDAVQAPVESVFAWFERLDETYVQWHPEAHHWFAWQTMGPAGPGSRFMFEESFSGGKTQRMLMEITRFVKNRELSFQSVRIEIGSRFLPAWLLSWGGRLLKIRMEMHRTFVPVSDRETWLQTTHKLGSRRAFIGSMADWVLDRMVFPVQDHVRHLAEETRYMKEALAQLEGGCHTDRLEL